MTHPNLPDVLHTESTGGRLGHFGSSVTFSLSGGAFIPSAATVRLRLSGRCFRPPPPSGGVSSFGYARNSDSD